MTSFYDYTEIRTPNLCIYCGETFAANTFNRYPFDDPQDKLPWPNAEVEEVRS